MNILPEHRNSNGSMKMRLTKLNTSGLSSNKSLEDEIWAQIDYLHTVTDAREKFLKSKGITDGAEITNIGSELSAYLTQAKNFYMHAKNSDYRSAALLYYYSFLNLAKAIIVLKEPSLAGKRFNHGLRRQKTKGSLEKLSMTLSNTNPSQVNVFSEFYKIVYGKPFIFGVEINLMDLFSYCSSITLEYEDIAEKPNRISTVRYVIAIDASRKKSWNLIAVHDWNKQMSYGNSYKRFLKDFEKVNVPSLYRQSQFEIKGPAYGVSFFEAKKEIDFIFNESIDWFRCRNDLHTTLEGLYQTSVYNAEISGFEMVAPIDDNSDIRLNEITSTYMAMYYLSEIVRYDPSLFDGDMSINTKDGWLIKAFIDQAPETFLYRSLSLLKDDDILYEKRH